MLTEYKYSCNKYKECSQNKPYNILLSIFSDVNCSSWDIPLCFGQTKYIISNKLLNPKPQKVCPQNKVVYIS